jgi:hypothetical protein
MIDLAALALTVLIVLVVMVRKTSAGVAILALLAGVLLDQMLSEWIISFIPQQSSEIMLNITAVVHLLLTFTPALVSIVAVKVGKHHLVPSLLASLALGFLVTFFATKIIAPLAIVPEQYKESGLLVFMQPYQNAILAGSALIAIFEMTLSYHKTNSHRRSKKLFNR